MDEQSTLPNSLPPDEPTEHQKAEGEALLRKLMTEDDFVKESMSMQLTGMRLMHYGFGRVRHRLHMQKQLPPNDKLPIDPEVAEAAAACAFAVMKKISGEAFQQDHLLNGLTSAVSTMQSDIAAHAEMAKKVRETELKMGLPTFSSVINTLTKGGMRAGLVLVVAGEAAPVFKVLAQFIRHFNSVRAPITHFTTAKSDMHIPGVKVVPESWWSKGCQSLSRAEEVFHVADGYVMLIDRLDWLVGIDESHSRRKSLRCLYKMSKRYRQGIIVGVQDEQFDTKVDGVYVVRVAQRKMLDGKSVIMVGDEIYEETADGRMCVPGNQSPPVTKLEGQDGRPEGAKELEGPGEDRGEDRRVGE